MGERVVVPLLYGAGLDRATGIYSVEGRAGRDLRNVLLYRDKAQVRHGHSAVNLLVDEGGAPLEDVLLVTPMSAEQIGLVAGYGSDRRVHLFRISGDGSGLSRIGTAFTLAAGAHAPPRVLAAEQYSKIFVAHDEAVRLLRAPTMYYDPFGAPALNTLTADLDGDGTPGDVLFRGVAPYLTYLVGWGFGTETDPDHPEIVRVSDPEDPTSFAPDDYFSAGVGGSPVLSCLPAGTAENSCVLVMKPTQIHQIFGYDRASFGIRQIEDGRGVAASRLAIAVGGVVYFWDPEGPRRSSGGPSEDLSWPLDLEAPSPADLAAAGAVADGFACYLPSRRCVLFVFGERIYVLSLWDATALKWSYGELGVPAQAGGVLYSGLDTPTTAPTGSAANVVLSVVDDETVQAAWDNSGLTGGEVAEVWLHGVTDDTWTLAGQAMASGPAQTVNCVANAGTTYEAQIRYRRGPFYRADYQSSDPADWPAATLSNQVTTTLAAPVLTTAWNRVSATEERTVLTWTGTLTVPSVVTRDAFPIATIPAGAPLSYADTGMGGEQYHTYIITQQGADLSTPSAPVLKWAGPFPAVTSFDSLVIAGGLYSAAWTTANPDSVLVDLRDEVQLSGFYEDIRTVAAQVLNRPVAAIAGGPVPNPVNPGDLIDVRLRHVETTFGVDDFSPDQQLTVAFA